MKIKKLTLFKWGIYTVFILFGGSQVEVNNVRHWMLLISGVLAIVVVAELIHYAVEHNW